MVCLKYQSLPIQGLASITRQILQQFVGPVELSISLGLVVDTGFHRIRFDWNFHPENLGIHDDPI